MAPTRPRLYLLPSCVDALTWLAAFLLRRRHRHHLSRPSTEIQKENSNQ